MVRRFVFIATLLNTFTSYCHADNWGYLSRFERQSEDRKKSLTRDQQKVVTDLTETWSRLSVQHKELCWGKEPAGQPLPNHPYHTPVCRRLRAEMHLYSFQIEQYKSSNEALPRQCNSLFSLLYEYIQSADETNLPIGERTLQTLHRYVTGCTKKMQTCCSLQDPGDSSESKIGRREVTYGERWSD